MHLTEEYLAAFRAAAPGGASSACWLWTGSVHPRGYGRFGHNYVSDLAHRAAWVAANGRQVPAGKVIRHRCGVLLCVNPAHLYAGEHGGEVTRRLVAEAAAAPLALPEGRGEGKSSSKLTEAQVVDARARYGGGESLSSIARSLGVSRQCVMQVVRRETWAHVR